MGAVGKQSRHPDGGRKARLRGATALACVLAGLAAAPAARAQDLGAIAADQQVPSGSQMLLEADTLTYDNDLQTVTAEGGVRIEYGGNRLVANRVTYNRQTGRLTATGGVEVVDQDGTRITSDEIDITDDFGDGFVNALRVETIDKTYFAAESAERRGGRITTFNNGVYTACEPCEEEPDRAPIWRIKSRRIIWNGEEKTIRFESSRFEFFGLPIAYFPVFEIPDPTVKRKSGFLIPSFLSDDELGTGVRVPYYFALSPTFDLTVAGRYYSRQGFLGEAEWRQRFNNGQYLIQAAGIRQEEPEAFLLSGIYDTEDSGPEDDRNRERFMIGSIGEFTINPRWTFGWDLLAQTDKNFSKTYEIERFSDTIQRDEVYLVGLNDRNFFDLRSIHFQVQEEVPDDGPLGPASRDDEQPFVLPSWDYSVTPDEPVFGGELNLDVNARALRRGDLDAFGEFTDIRLEEDPFIRGLEGSNGRVTAEAEWKRTMVTDAGLLVTPLLHFQADSNYSDPSSEAEERLEDMAAQLNASPAYTGDTVESDVRSSFNRYMATLGMELRWPVLFSSTSATHVLEPMAQVFARPSEQHIGGLGIPNEDAQSFVFDASTLFERDKFSGYDRIEGGTRANVGLRYTGTIGNGWTTNAIVGQSFHLAGENSFDQPDLVNVGAYSGLETDTSDLVALVGFATPTGLSMSLSGRFDEDSLDMRRGEAKAAYVAGPVSLSGSYAFIEEQPLYGFREDRQEASATGVLRFAEHWSVFGNATYDLERDLLSQNGFGVGYADECFTYTLTYAESRSRNYYTGIEDNEQKVGFTVAFRTLGDFGSERSIGGSDTN